MRIIIDVYNDAWWWRLERIDSGRGIASGSARSYDEACRMAKIAWEQHSEAISD